MTEESSMENSDFYDCAGAYLIGVIPIGGSVASPF